MLSILHLTIFGGFCPTRITHSIIIEILTTTASGRIFVDKIITGAIATFVTLHRLITLWRLFLETDIH